MDVPPNTSIDNLESTIQTVRNYAMALRNVVHDNFSTGSTPRSQGRIRFYKKFHFMHCYHALKDKAKWRNLVSSKKSKTAGSASRASRLGEEVYADLEGQTANTVHNDSERPEDRNAAKRSRTSSSSAWNESVLKETADSMNAQFLQTEARRQELIELQHEKHQQELAKRHEQLLASRREKIAMLREIKEKKMQQKEKLKAIEIKLKNKHFRMELEGRELNMIMQLDLTKLDDVPRKYYEKKKMKLPAKLDDEE